MTLSRDSVSDHPGNQNHSQNGQRRAECFPARQLFMENQGRQKDDDRRFHVVTECRCCNRRISVRLKQQNPVDPDHSACQGEQKKCPKQRALRCLLSRDADKSQEKQAAENAACAGQRRRGKRDKSSEDADRSEDQHGEYKHDQGTVIL